MPAWRGSSRRESLPSDWEQRRKRQFALDGHRCVAIMLDGSRCTGPAEECDHKTNRYRHEPGIDLQSLCSWHHAKKSGEEGARGRQQKLDKAKAKFRREEVHPTPRRYER